jgi:hypothetical protein
VYIVAPIRSRLTVNTSEAAVPGCCRRRRIDPGDVVQDGYSAARGVLAVVLDAFEPEPLSAHIVYAERKPAPLKLRAFLNWMTPRLKARLAQ